MAGVEYHEFSTQEVPSAGFFGKLFNLVGAASSVALIAGLGYWGYQLTIRDVTDVPVIRALEGPARVQPADPGGQLAQHQGLSVNNVQADGIAEGPAPQVILAPSPIDLDADDMVLAPAEDDDVFGTVVSLPADAENSVDAVAQALALAEQLAAGVEPLESSEEIRVSMAVAPVPVTVPGVKRSPRPASRPKFDRATYNPSAIEAAIAAAIEVNPSEIEAGTRLVQLGAFDTRDEAAAEWKKITVRFEEYIEGKSRVIEEASSGGSPFFRLRAYGFADLTASRRFCAVLVAANASCIPVQVK
jgi:hypothetical protein